jgi:hypothetical protein
LKASSQAGHVICLEPGLGLSRRRRSQDGQAISTLTTFDFTTISPLQDEQATMAGLSRTPHTRTLEQFGQANLSLAHSFRVGSCSILATAPHKAQVFIPRPKGNIPSQLGQFINGGATSESTSKGPDSTSTSSSVNESPQLRGFPIIKIPLGVKVNGKSRETPHSSAASSSIFLAAIASLAEPSIPTQ